MAHNYSEGFAIDGDDMHWTVDCPQCGKRYEYQGFFDSSDDTICQCGCTFKTSRVWLDESNYIN